MVDKLENMMLRNTNINTNSTDKDYDTRHSAQHNIPYENIPSFEQMEVDKDRATNVDGVEVNVDNMTLEEYEDVDMDIDHNSIEDIKMSRGKKRKKKNKIRHHFIINTAGENSEREGDLDMMDTNSVIEQ